MNSINLTGRLTADVILKSTANGKSVCSFSLAVLRPGVKDKTDFIEIVAWEATAEFITTYFKKGSLIAITGVLTTRRYNDNDGNPRKAYEVVCRDVSFCGGSKNTEQGERTDEPTALEGVGEQDDELPF